MRRIRVVFKRIALIAVGIPVLIFLAMVSLNTYWYSQITRELDTIRKEGYPVTREDFVLPEVPDEDNAAPLYQQAFDLLPESDSDDWRTITDFLKEEKREDNPELWNDARQIMAQYSGVIDLTMEAVAKPKCQFQTDTYNKPILFPDHHSRMRLVRFLGCASILGARDGDMYAAVKYVKTGYEVARSFNDEPTLIGSLAQIGVLGIMSNILKQSLNYGNLSEGQAHDLLETISAIDPDQLFVDALAAERTRYFLWISEWRRCFAYYLLMLELMDEFDISFVDEYFEDFINDPPDVTGLRGVAWRARGEAYLRCLYLGDQLAWLRFMGRQIDAISMPYSELVSSGLMSEDPDFPRYAVASRIMGETLTPVQGPILRSRVRLAMDQVFISLMAHKARHGEFPESLHELAVDNLPNDPYSGEPLRYERKPEGFVLYSVGPDLKDDGRIEVGQN